MNEKDKPVYEAIARPGQQIVLTDVLHYIAKKWVINEDDKEHSELCNHCYKMVRCNWDVGNPYYEDQSKSYKWFVREMVRTLERNKNLPDNE